MTDTEAVLAKGHAYLIENFGRLPFVMSRGSGAHIWDQSGRRYIDFFAGFGGCGVTGHAHPKIAAVSSHRASRG